MNELTFNFGAKVHCADNSFGSLAKLVVEPKNLQVVNLIAESGLLLKRARVIPVSKISSMDEDNIYLTVTSEELLTLPEYRETKMERPAANAQGSAYASPDGMTTAPVVPMVYETIREGISPEMKLFTSHTAVQNEGAPVGKLQAINIWNADHKISGIVVRHGLVFPEVESIPIGEIEEFAEDVVALRPQQPTPATFLENH